MSAIEVPKTPAAIRRMIVEANPSRPYLSFSGDLASDGRLVAGGSWTRHMLGLSTIFEDGTYDVTKKGLGERLDDTPDLVGLVDSWTPLGSVAPETRIMGPGEVPVLLDGYWGLMIPFVSEDGITFLANARRVAFILGTSDILGAKSYEVGTSRGRTMLKVETGERFWQSEGYVVVHRA